MPDRIACLVPFCRCTVSRARLDPAHDEWICAKHWRAVSGTAKSRRVIVRNRQRRVARACLRYQAAARLPSAADRERRDRASATVARAAARAWRRCKAEAIEAAGGIG